MLTDLRLAFPAPMTPGETGDGVLAVPTTPLYAESRERPPEMPVGGVVGAERATTIQLRLHNPNERLPSSPNALRAIAVDRVQLREEFGEVVLVLLDWSVGRRKGQVRAVGLEVEVVGKLETILQSSVLRLDGFDGCEGLGVYGSR